MWFHICNIVHGLVNNCSFMFELMQCRLCFSLILNGPFSQTKACCLSNKSSYMHFGLTVPLLHFWLFYMGMPMVILYIYIYIYGRQGVAPLSLALSVVISLCLSRSVVKC